METISSLHVRIYGTECCGSCPPWPSDIWVWGTREEDRTLLARKSRRAIRDWSCDICCKCRWIRYVHPHMLTISSGTDSRAMATWHLRHLWQQSSDFPCSSRPGSGSTLCWLNQSLRSRTHFSSYGHVELSEGEDTWQPLDNLTISFWTSIRQPSSNLPDRIFGSQDWDS